MRIPDKAPTIKDLAPSRLSDPQKFQRILQTGPLVEGRYEHWHRLKYLQRPAGLSVPDWWLGLKLARFPLQKAIQLNDPEGIPFSFATPDNILRMLHEVDQRASGVIEMPEAVTNPASRDRYIISSLIEEAVTSSQLEGASTTTDVAKRMIRSGRRPSDRSEQMIYNNYQAMQFVREHKGDKLTPERVFHLHRLVTEDTLDDPGKAGAFRDDSDDIVVQRGGRVIHVPPPAAELPARLSLMCQFANERIDNQFIHPVVRAVLLHFWLAYDHPFVDGNGRAARALFYWSMLSQKYWLTEYLSISKILTKAPAQYANAFLLTETDDNDLTYFLEYQLGVICRAIDELHKYLGRKSAEVRHVEALLRESGGFNYRQLALLSHALKHPGHRYTIESHRRSHDVVYETARTDILGLVRRRLLAQQRRGKVYEFSAPTNIAEMLKAAASGDRD